MSETISVERSGHVVSVVLNRPEKRNAINLGMFEELIRIGSDLQSDQEVRAVILRGQGGHFCAGIDIAVIQAAQSGDLDSNLLKAGDHTPANFFQSAAYVWREIPVPVIAVLDGSVFGAGLQIAMGADIRYAGPDAQLSIMEVKWGLIPDMAITQTMRHVVSTDKVRELAYTGRIVAAAEASAIGLVTDVAEDPLDRARVIAGEIAARSPDAIRACKQLIGRAWEGSARDALRLEAQYQANLMAGDNFGESVRANLDKRMPDFAAATVSIRSDPH